MTYTDLLNNIKNIISDWDEQLEKPISNEDLVDFMQNVNFLFSMQLPIDYVNFLKINNGLEFNGLVIFGSKNSLYPEASLLALVEANNIFRDLKSNISKNIILIGETSTGVLTYDYLNNVYQFRDRIALERIEVYASFDELMTIEINKVL